MTHSVSASAATPSEDLLADVPPPTLAASAADANDTLRLGPVPRPRPDDAKLPFPPVEGAPPRPERPPVPSLDVVRVQPEGGVETVDRVVVQFNQPMVPVASVGALENAPLPLEIEPALEGRARWLDTQTLVFEAPRRLPFATVFKARVPAGTASALGAKLEQAYEWSFETPEPRILSVRPWNGSTGQDLDTMLRLEANVPLGEGFLKAASLRTAAGEAVAFEMRRPEAAGNEPAERTVHLVPKSKLKKDTEYVFALAAGWSTGEGPKPGVAFTTKFRTYGQMKVTEVDCGWGRRNDPCPAYQPIRVRFSNYLEPEQEPGVEVAPAVEDLGTELRGDVLVIHGRFRPATAYRITIKKGLRDTHGQLLAKDHTANVRMSSLESRFQFGGGGPLQVLESGAPALRGWAVNVPEFRVRALTLDTKAWITWAAGHRDNSFQGKQAALDRTMPGSAKNDSAAVSLPLDEVFAQGRGLALVEVTGLNMSKDRWGNHFSVLVQATDLGLLATLSDERVEAVASSLAGGEAIAGAGLELVDDKGNVLARATSDKGGRASLAVPVGKTPFALVGRHGGSTSILPLSGKKNTLKQPVPAAYLFTDRGVYRPGEPVKLSALLRQRTTGPEGDLLPAAPGKATLVLRDPGWNEVLRKELTTDAHGFVHLEWTAPKGGMLGEWRATLETSGKTEAGAVSFMVQEYRTPELKVQASLAAEVTPTPAGAAATGSVEAGYYFGGPVARQPVGWTLTRTATAYIPPNNAGFHFGVERPLHKRWYWHTLEPQVVEIASGSGTLDGEGRFSVPLRLGLSDVPGPDGVFEHKNDTSEESAWTYVFEASVADANRQSIAGRASVLAHRSLRRAGIRLSRSVLQPGEETTVEAVVVDLDGTRVAGVPVSVILTNDDGVEKARCDLVSESEPVGCRLSPDTGGVWSVAASAADAEGRMDTAARILWVAGGMSTSEGEPSIDIIADKEAYAPGDTARLLVRSPFPKARGLLVAGREGLAETVPIEVTNGSAVVELKIREVWLPRITVQAVLAAPRSGEAQADGLDPHRPRWVAGQTDLAVATGSRRLHTGVTLSKAVASPREPITVEVSTADPSGAPVSAHVTVMVVDEAVLALTGFATPDPAAGVYAPRQPGIDAVALQEMLMEAGTVPDEETLTPVAGKAAMSRSMKKEMSDALAEEPGRGRASPQVRSDFVTTPYFMAKLVTDDAGGGRTTFNLPDNLTQFRVMAVAADQGRLFGAGEASVTSRLPIQVRPSLPRFLNLGDSFTASAVVDNRTDAEAEIVVRMLAANAEVLETHRTVRLAPGESKEVRFPARAGKPGPAKFQVAARIVGNEQARDAVEVIVPTLIPATAEAFATYGSTEGSVAQPVQRPAGALAGFGGLDVQLSSTALTGLRDAVEYLAEYPHGCTEQLTSRLVPFVALKDVFAAFGLDTATDPEKAIRETLAAIEKNRRPDDGFGYWASSPDSSVHLTAWVALVMQEAQRRGLLEDSYALERTLSRLPRLARNPPQYWERLAAEPRALAALVLARAGRADVALLEDLSERKLPIFVHAWLAEAWHLSKAPVAAERVKEHLRIVRNAAVETAGTVHFAERATETMRLLLHSSELTDAIVLHALLTIDATDPMIDKLARGLSQRRHRGHWGTTHADAWAVLAMSELFARREAQEPKFDARVWLGDIYAGGRAFSGRELTVSQLAVPMDKVPEGDTEVLLAKQGPGRLYWRVGLRYAPADLRPKALDQGFVVSRTYEPLDPDSVRQDDDGTWHVKAGARVRVRLKVVVPDRRYHVALVDPMPAGFEAENSALATTAHIEPDEAPENRWWHWSPWTHTELRDDRAQAFAEGLWAGIYEHTWVARATTPGRFIVPPARAEEMYAPETFGRCAADTVVVE